jgi:hypothetical protein
MMDTRGYVDITELDLKTLVKEVYDRSLPAGLGWFHFTEGPLDEETADSILALGVKYNDGGIRMDYVHGRQCKFDVRAHEGRRYAKLNWYDHSVEAMKKLMRDLMLPDVEARLAKAEIEEEERRKEDEEEYHRYREEHPI